jgi:ribosomal protein S13
MKIGKQISREIMRQMGDRPHAKVLEIDEPSLAHLLEHLGWSHSVTQVFGLKIVRLINPGPVRVF